MYHLAYLFTFISLCKFVYSPYTGPAPGNATFYYEGSALTQPTVISSSGGSLNIELTVKTFRMNSFISYSTRAYHYNNVGLIPGPTLVIKPGDNVTVTLINELTGAGQSKSDEMTHMNMLMCTNATNLHTHGLHVDPNIDTIFTYANPGERITYRYRIPDNHAPGLHWYHSHKHGESALQVMGGLYGAIYVAPSDASNLPPELTQLTSNILIFSHFSTDRVNTYDDPFTIRTYRDLISLTGDQLIPNFQYTNPSIRDVYLTNGNFQPFFNMKAGQNYIFEMLNANGDHTIEIEIRTAINGGTKACTMTQLSIDGVYFTNARQVNFVVMVSAQRASIAVNCPTAGTYYLQTNADLVSRPDVGDTEARFNQNLLTLKVGTGSGDSTVITPNLSLIKRPSYLTDLTKYTPDSKWSISVDQAAQSKVMWLGIGKDCTISNFGRASDSSYLDPTTNKNCSYLPFPGSLGNKGVYRHIGKVNNVEEITLWGRGRTPHNLHIHVNHFQIISSLNSNGDNGAYPLYFGAIGDWRDTIPSLTGSTILRYRLDTYTGEIVLHCHFLLHEDMGMMATFYSGNSDCNFPSNCVDSSTATQSNNSGSTSNSNLISISLNMILFFLVFPLFL